VDALAADPRTAGRVHVLDAVNPSVVVDTVAGADVAVMAIEGTTRNHLLSTPNKLFEALAAGVPVVVSDFPGMRRIVLGNPDGPLGAVCDPASSSSVAAAIREILDQAPDQITAMRSRCRRAADTRWNWETEATGLLALYAELGAEAERGADAERLPEHGPV
jgi:glycosyltransferase involved in cell wall biosynthesis